MTHISYDPEQVPKVPTEMIRIARENDWKIVSVICDDPLLPDDEDGSVHFFALTEFIPAAGSRLGLEDGTLCEVQRHYYKVGKFEGHPALYPNVYAVKISQD